MRPHRVEIPQTLAGLPFLGAERFGERPAQRLKRDGVWLDLTYAELRDIAREVGLGLVALGVCPGDRMCILSETRPEWVQAELGIAAAGAVVVPIYPSSSPEECEWVIGNSGAVAVICENAAQLAKIEQIRHRLPELRHTVVVDPADAAALSLERLRARGRDGDRSELERRTAGVQPDDSALIIYTSGTTGPPKGCVLTQRNMTACCRITAELKIVGADDVAYLFLPLAHVFAQVVQLSVASVGGVVAYSSGGASTIVPDCAEVRPTYVPSVPRVFEKVHALFASQVPADTLSKMVKVGLAVRRLERAGEPVPEQLRRGFEQADATLFAKVRAVFGGQMRMAISGAAPIAPGDPRVLPRRRRAGVRGLWPQRVGSRRHPQHRRGDQDRKHRASGPRLRDPQRRGRRASNARSARLRRLLGEPGGHRGGARGRVAADRRPRLDRRGWLRHDHRAQERHHHHCGRQEHHPRKPRERPAPVTVDLAGGRVRRPEAVPGRAHHPRRRAAYSVGSRAGLPADLAALAPHPSVHAFVQAAVDQANARYAKVAQVKKFAILDHDLSQETGELTPTLKVKRQFIQHKYAHVFDALYDELR